MVTGAPVSASQAKKVNLVDVVVPASQNVFDAAVAFIQDKVILSFLPSLFLFFPPPHFFLPSFPLLILPFPSSHSFLFHNPSPLLLLVFLISSPFCLLPPPPPIFSFPSLSSFFLLLPFTGLFLPRLAVFCPLPSLHLAPLFPLTLLHCPFLPFVESYLY